ncbi:MAG: hypothetical protein Wins2KO_12920 [Winogradskyella sp.]
MIKITFRTILLFYLFLISQVPIYHTITGEVSFFGVYLDGSKDPKSILSSVEILEKETSLQELPIMNPCVTGSNTRFPVGSTSTTEDIRYFIEGTSFTQNYDMVRYNVETNSVEARRANISSSGFPTSMVFNSNGSGTVQWYNQDFGNEHFYTMPQNFVSSTSRTQVTSTSGILQNPRYFAYDAINDRIFSVEINFGTSTTFIKSYDTNGTNASAILQNTGSTFTSYTGLSLDAVNDEMYWSDPNTSSIFKASMTATGGSRTTIVNGLGSNVKDITLDLTNRKVYWIDQGSGFNGTIRIRSADIDGTVSSNNSSIVTHYSISESNSYGADEIEINADGSLIYWGVINFSSSVSRIIGGVTSVVNETTEPIPLVTSSGNSVFAPRLAIQSNLLNDNNPPAVPSTPDLDALSDTCTSDNDNITDDITPTFNGTAEANVTVSLISSIDSNIGSTISNSTGQWSITASTLSLGDHNITATATDTEGNTSESSSALSVTITTLDDASFSYSASEYCVDASDPTPTIPGLIGGSFSSEAGLSLNISTGQIDLSASIPGTYTVTYTTTGICPNSSSVAVTINALDDASFSYDSNNYNVLDSDPTPTITGLIGGSFSSEAGLSLDVSTGLIDLSTSIPGTYTVIYTTSGLCPSSFNTEVTIDDTLSISDIEKSDSISIFPNPTGDELYIKVSDDVKFKSVVVYDLQSRTIKDVNLYELNRKINVKELKSATYLIIFTSTDGRKTIKKFIKK